MSTHHYQYDFQFRREALTHATQRLILLNVLVFAGQVILDVPFGSEITRGSISVLPPPGGAITEWLSFQPRLFLSGWLWSAFTYQFLHAGLMHLFMNMLCLFFFGPTVERRLGTRQFYRFYLVCGTLAVMATLLPWAFGDRWAISVIGASGAAMAVLMAFAVINPDRQLFLFPLPIPINARALVIIFIIMNLFSAAQGDGTSSVATHFGGMGIGFVYMKGIPRYRRWQTEQRRARAGSGKSHDPAGEMVDNIFEFDDKKRRR